jgi:hypothetical protein
MTCYGDWCRRREWRNAIVQKEPMLWLLRSIMLGVEAATCPHSRLTSGTDPATAVGRRLVAPAAEDVAVRVPT